MIVHYNPLNAFKQSNYYCYDVKTGRSIAGPPPIIYGDKGTAVLATPSGTRGQPLVPDNINNIDSTNDMIRTQGLVFVYQNFNFINSEKNMLIL